jgi:hypothetical protein
MNVTVAHTLRSQRGFRGSDRKLEETAQRGASQFVLLAKDD